MKMSVSKESLKGLPPMPEGLYEVRLDGWKPKKSAKGDSINLQPQMKVVNNAAGFNDRAVFENMNTNAGWIQQDFVHAFGLPMDLDGENASIPGDFVPDATDPDNVEKYGYNGPLKGRTGKVYLIQVPAKDKNGNIKPGQIQNRIKYYVCAVPGCTEKHSDNLS